MQHVILYVVGEAEKSSGVVNKGYTGDEEECDTTEGKGDQEDLDSSRTYKSAVCNKLIVVIDIFNFLLLMSLSLALASKLPLSIPLE